MPKPIHDDNKHPLEQRQYTCTSTWLTAQLHVSQVSYRCICLAVATLDTATSMKSTHTDHERPMTIPPTLALFCTTRRRHTWIHQLYTAAWKCPYPAQLILSQVSCRCICLAEATLDTATSMKPTLPHTDHDRPKTLTLTLSEFCTTRRRYTWISQLYTLAWTWTWTSLAQPILSQVSCRCICQAEASRYTAIKTKPPLPSPDVSDNQLSTDQAHSGALVLRVLRRSMIRKCQQNLRMMKEKYISSKKVSDRSNKCKHHAKRRAGSRDRERHNSSSQMLSLSLLNKTTFERVIHPKLQWIC